MNGTWLLQKLNQNGFTLSDLSAQSGISLEDLQKMAADQQASKEEWDVVLSVMNDYPSVRYPDASILDDLKNDLETYGADAQCLVFYGVSDNSIVFSEYQCMDDESMQIHGANVPTKYLSVLQLPLQQAQTLFTRQNCTISE